MISKQIFISLINTANKLDSIGSYSEANKLTRVAQRLIISESNGPFSSLKDAVSYASLLIDTKSQLLSGLLAKSISEETGGNYVTYSDIQDTLKELKNTSYKLQETIKDFKLPDGPNTLLSEVSGWIFLVDDDKARNTDMWQSCSAPECVVLDHLYNVLKYIQNYANSLKTLYETKNSKIIQNSKDFKNIKISYKKQMFIVPKGVQKAAQRGIALRNKYNRGGTSVGLNTARILSKGGAIGIEKVRHIGEPPTPKDVGFQRLWR